MFEKEKRLLMDAVQHALNDPNYRNIERHDIEFAAADAIHNGASTLKDVSREIERALIWHKLKLTKIEKGW